MTPKEKAEELVGKHAFIFYMGDIQPTRLQKFETHIYVKYAKQCARISVDEILNMISDSMNGFLDSDIVSYWQNVKKEIKKI